MLWGWTGGGGRCCDVVCHAVWKIQERRVDCWFKANLPKLWYRAVSLSIAPCLGVDALLGTVRDSTTLPRPPRFFPWPNGKRTALPTISGDRQTSPVRGKS